MRMVAYHAHMDTLTLIREAEERARSAGLSIAELCRRAGIFQSTWTRWKSGATQPNFKSWNAVIRALEDAERGEAA